MNIFVCLEGGFELKAQSSSTNTEAKQHLYEMSTEAGRKIQGWLVSDFIFKVVKTF